MVFPAQRKYERVQLTKAGGIISLLVLILKILQIFRNIENIILKANKAAVGVNDIIRSSPPSTIVTLRPSTVAESL